MLLRKTKKTDKSEVRYCDDLTALHTAAAGAVNQGKAVTLFPQLPLSRASVFLGYSANNTNLLYPVVQTPEKNKGNKMVHRYDTQHIHTCRKNFATSAAAAAAASKQNNTHRKAQKTSASSKSKK